MKKHFFILILKPFHIKENEQIDLFKNAKWIEFVLVIRKLSPLKMLDQIGQHILLVFTDMIDYLFMQEEKKEIN